jgi:hypothetical protein
VVLSAVVHLGIVGLAVGGILLIVLDWATVFQPVLGVTGICLALYLRPRRGKVDEEGLLRRADAPRLFALLDDIAEAVGTRGCDAVRLTPGFSIGAVPFGLRGRRLDIGLALWETLTPQQRIAWLAHAVGRFATGDVSHNLMVRTALSLPSRPIAPSGDSAALRERALAVSPASRRADEMAEAAGRFRADNALARWAIWLGIWPLRQVARLAQRLVAPLAEEAEARADVLAARVASTEAAVEALARLRLSAAVEAELRRLAVEAGTFGRKDAARELWRRLAAHAANVPAEEPPGRVVRERVRRLDERERYPAMVALDPTAAEALDRDMDTAKRAVAERFIRDRAGLGH